MRQGWDWNSLSAMVRQITNCAFFFWCNFVRVLVGCIVVDHQERSFYFHGDWWSNIYLKPCILASYVCWIRHDKMLSRDSWFNLCHNQLWETLQVALKENCQRTMFQVRGRYQWSCAINDVLTKSVSTHTHHSSIFLGLSSYLIVADLRIQSSLVPWFTQ